MAFFEIQLKFTIPQGWCLNQNANLGSTTVTNHGEPVPIQIVFKIKTLLKVLNHPFLNQKNKIKVGITFSALDLLHPGHVKMLEEAKQNAII